MIENKLLTVSELAEYLNVSRGWIYDHTRAGVSSLLPHYKLGKYLRFKLSDVLVYLDEHVNLKEQEN